MIFVAKNKGGRPNNYFTYIKPRFKEIKKWLEEGATEKEIAEQLGIKPQMICKYKKEFPEFSELLKKGHQKPVQAIKAALFKRACGFTYQEETIVEKNGCIESVQKFTKCALPDPTAALMLLKHWDDEIEWTQDPALLKLKKKELELKRERFEAGEEDWE